MRRRRLAILLCLTAACARADSSAITRVTAPAGVDVRLLRVDARDAEGLSGATMGASGDLWVVAERQRQLLRMKVSDGALATHAAPVLLDGLEADLEAESLAWLGDNRVLLGTETGNERDHDLLLLMTITGDRAAVTRRIAIDYTALGVRAEDNHGVEGACAVDEQLVLALEQRGPDGIATLLLHDLKSGAWQVRRLRLTTPTGKLASLDCRSAASPAAIEVVAIERHYGVGRVLAFSLDPRHDAATQPIAPRVLIDLAHVVQPVPNFESVVVIGEDVIVITDNHHARVTGPTQALRLRGLRLATSSPR